MRNDYSFLATLKQRKEKDAFPQKSLARARLLLIGVDILTKTRLFAHQKNTEKTTGKFNKTTFAKPKKRLLIFFHRQNNKNNVWKNVFVFPQNCL